MKILFVFGTHPEAIKMAPLIQGFQQASEAFEIRICVTAQHCEMLDQSLDFFNICSDYDLNLMRPDQTLSQLASDILLKLEPVFDDFMPDNVFIQGDTTTVMTTVLLANYKRISISHLEAGLRSHRKTSPFPEEINRVIAGHVADYHFAPTRQAVRNLAREGITEHVWQVGNTVIDAPAYLYPNRFQPDENMVRAYGLNPFEYMVVRCSALKAHQDRRATGLVSVWQRVEKK